MPLAYTAPAVVTVASTASETSLGAITLPAKNLYDTLTYTIIAAGVYGIAALTTPTLLIKVKFGTVILAASPTITMPAGVTNLGWRLEAQAVVRTVGASGTVETQGVFILETVSLTTSVDYFMKNTATVTVDTTAATALGITATWGTSSASNTISARLLTIERE